MPRRGQARVLTAVEFQSVLAVASTGLHPERNVALLHLAFGLGLIPRELAVLACGQVAHGVRRLLSALVWPDDPERQELPLRDAGLRAALRAHLSARHCGRWSSSAALFVSQRGAFSANSLQQVFARLFEIAGIEGASAYSGRRTFAARLLAKGMPPPTLAALLGISVAGVASYYPERPVDLDAYF